MMNRLILTVLIGILIIPAALLADTTGIKAVSTDKKPVEMKSASGTSEKYLQADYLVENLDETMTKKLSVSLAEYKEIMKISPNLEEGVLSVIYSGEKDFSDKILEILKETAGTVKMGEIKEIDAAALKGCGGCPHKAKCAKAKSVEGKPAEEKTSGCAGEKSE